MVCIYIAFVQSWWPSASQYSFFIHPCEYVQHFLYNTLLMHCQHSRQGQFGVQYLAQGHFSTHNGWDGAQTADLLFSGWPTLSPETQYPHFNVTTAYLQVYSETLAKYRMWSTRLGRIHKVSYLTTTSPSCLSSHNGNETSFIDLFQMMLSYTSYAQQQKWGSV